MKKHLLALAALATVSGVAAAQSATVYGIIDLSVTTASNISTTSPTATGRFTGLTDATWMPSVFGVTGSEDLGSGLKATFNLESDINADTGNTSAASGNKLFGRKANVGLSGGFGTITAGKDIDMIFLQGFIDNVRNSHSASGFVAHAVANNAGLDTETVFVQNMVRYTTPTVGGFKASIQHKFGEVAGDQSKGKSTAYLGNYAAGGLTLAIGYKELESTANAKTELTYVGATYQVGAVRLAATHHETKYKTSGAGKIKTDEVGVGYAVTPSLTAAVNYVHEKQDAAKGDITSASLKYALSKRTSLWTLVAKTNYDGFNIAAGNYPIGVATAKDSTSTSVGITHAF